MPGLDHIAGTGPGDAPLAVETDVDDEVAAGHERDAGVFLVDRVAVEDAAIRLRVLQKARAVPDLDGFEGGDSRADDLTATGVASHEVRLDQAGRDLEIGTEITAVEPNRHAIGRFAEVIVFLQHLAVVILNPVIGDDLRTEHLFQLGAFVGPVQAGGDENENILPRHALLLQRPQQGRQDELVRHRPRNVADKDAGVLAAVGEVRERRRADRAGQCLGDCGLRVRQWSRRSNRQWPDDAIVGQFHVQASPTVVESHAHRFLVLSPLSLANDLFWRLTKELSTLLFAQSRSRPLQRACRFAACPVRSPCRGSPATNDQGLRLRTKDEFMSIDKSLRRKNSLQRARNVLTRGERIKLLKDEERWPEGRSPFGLPKVKVIKIVVKKVKKAKEEEKPGEGEAAAAAEGAAAPAAAAEKKPAEKKPAEKKPAEKKGDKK